MSSIVDYSELIEKYDIAIGNQFLYKPYFRSYRCIILDVVYVKVKDEFLVTFWNTCTNRSEGHFLTYLKDFIYTDEDTMKYLSRDILINKEYLFLDDPVKVTDIYIEKNIFNDIIYVEYIKIKR